MKQVLLKWGKLPRPAPVNGPAAHFPSSPCPCWKKSIRNICDSVLSSHAHLRLSMTDVHPHSRIADPQAIFEFLLQKQVKTKDVRKYTLIPNAPREYSSLFWPFLATPYKNCGNSEISNLTHILTLHQRSVRLIVALKH